MFDALRDGWKYERRDMLLALALFAVAITLWAVSVGCLIWYAIDNDSLISAGIAGFLIGEAWEAVRPKRKR